SKREKLEDTAVTSPRRDRAEIVKLAMKLFKLVTDVDLDTNDLDQGKKQAETPYTLDRMKRLSTEVLAHRELAVQQHIIIPLSIALNHYVNIMYDTVEQSDKEEQ
ncbi:MAG: hypothetical protein ACRD8W_30850, partial [Nitrososphaeraceae archaeon]